MRLAIIAALVASCLAGWALSAQGQVRVLCSDPVRGYLSADMNLGDAMQTPHGWVLYFPHRAAERRVEFWETCEVRP